MSQRPRFDKVNSLTVSADAFNELVDYYDELADAYEDMFVKRMVLHEAVQMMDFRTIAILNSLVIGLQERINQDGYKEYAKAALSGERQAQNQHAPPTLW